MVGSDWLRATLVTSSSFSIWLIICPVAGHHLPAARCGCVRCPEWQTENAFDVKRATGKSPHTWVMTPGWLRTVSSRMTLSHCFAWLIPHHFSIGRTRRYHRIHFLLCVDAHVDRAGPGRSMIACSAACGSTSLFKSQVCRPKPAAICIKLIIPDRWRQNALLIEQALLLMHQPQRFVVQQDNFTSS